MKKYLALAAIAALVGFVSCTKPDDGPKEKISVSPKSVTFSGDGGEQKVAVKSADATFTATADVDWLTVSVNGKEVVLTAKNNATKAERSCKVKVADSFSSCEVEVIQQIGSPVPGFAPIDSMTYEYGGKMMFVNYPNPTYGGCAYLAFTDLDGNKLSIACFTDLFASEEEVCLTEGTYTPGKDEMTTYYAVPCTWIPGSSFQVGDGEAFDFGSYFVSIDGTVTYLVSGIMEVKDGVIKIDMKDAEGNEYKYAYDGDYELTISAKFAGERPDPTDNIFRVMCMDNDESEAGAASKILTIYAGSESTPTMTMIYFNVDPAAEDIAGMYTTPMSEDLVGTAGTTDLGMMMDLGFMQIPMGTAIMFSNGDMWAADGMVSLMLTNKGDGVYTIFAMLADQEAMASETGEDGNTYMFMGDYSIEMDASEEED
ncbi:MAG: BACON domain-containing protein [Bacteroidales bacterium]|nr:BACON domain-containing protein [Candidatus Cryptobacteroides caccocaballi]